VLDGRRAGFLRSTVDSTVCCARSATRLGPTSGSPTSSTSASAPSRPTSLASCENSLNATASRSPYGPTRPAHQALIASIRNESAVEVPAHRGHTSPPQRSTDAVRPHGHPRVSSARCRNRVRGPAPQGPRSTAIVSAVHGRLLTCRFSALETELQRGGIARSREAWAHPRYAGGVAGDADRFGRAGQVVLMMRPSWARRRPAGGSSRWVVTSTSPAIRRGSSPPVRFNAMTRERPSWWRS
jgi:hypothetical protein